MRPGFSGYFITPQKDSVRAQSLKEPALFQQDSETGMKAKNLIENSFLFGSGFNNLRYIKRDKGIEVEKWQTSHSASGLDNSILFLLATTGFAGLVQYALFWKSILVKTKYNKLLIASID
jgi:hypothetical protein